DPDAHIRLLSGNGVAFRHTLPQDNRGVVDAGQVAVRTLPTVTDGARRSLTLSAGFPGGRRVSRRAGQSATIAAFRFWAQATAAPTAMTDATPAIDQLLKNLDQAMQADRHRLRRQLHELQKRPDEARLAQWLERFQASCARVEKRRRSVPAIRYDDALPIAAKRDEIKQALQEHQVLVIAGETGSGKTTQLPKICLEIGRGV